VMCGGGYTGMGGPSRRHAKPLGDGGEAYPGLPRFSRRLEGRREPVPAVRRSVRTLSPKVPAQILSTQPWPSHGVACTGIAALSLSRQDPAVDAQLRRCQHTQACQAVLHRLLGNLKATCKAADQIGIRQRSATQQRTQASLDERLGHQ
jgi:hypothetical protein